MQSCHYPWLVYRVQWYKLLFSATAGSIESPILKELLFLSIAKITEKHDDTLCMQSRHQQWGYYERKSWRQALDSFCQSWTWLLCSNMDLSLHLQRKHWGFWWWYVKLMSIFPFVCNITKTTSYRPQWHQPRIA
jgi:hypothetical protein